MVEGQSVTGILEPERESRGVRGATIFCEKVRLHSLEVPTVIAEILPVSLAWLFNLVFRYSLLSQGVFRTSWLLDASSDGVFGAASVSRVNGRVAIDRGADGSHDTPLTAALSAEHAGAVMAVLFFALFVFATRATTPWHSGLRFVATSARLEDDSIPATPPAPAVRTAQRQVTEVTIPMDIVHELIHHLKRLEAYDWREQIRVVVRQSRRAR